MRAIKRVPDEWLEETNKELADEGVPVNDRVERAIGKWQQQNPNDFMLMEGEAEADLTPAVERELNRIRSYFLTQRNKDWGYITSLFTGVFYYLGVFWEFDIPLAFGSPGIKPLRYLKMTDPPAGQLVSNKEDLREYVHLFADSYDYAYSIEELQGMWSNRTSEQLFNSADKHLRGVKALLYQEKVSSKVVEDARMSIEMFLKAYIAHIDALDDGALKNQYGHNLDIVADRCIATGASELTGLKARILRFPDVSSRYNIEERTFGELWSSYVLALRSALAVLRPLSGRDCRKNFGL